MADEKTMRERNFHDWELPVGAQLCLPWGLPDIPRFDVVFGEANNYGEEDLIKILGVELMSTGYGPSINEIVSEHSYHYIAYASVEWMKKDKGQLRLPGVQS